GFLGIVVVDIRDIPGLDLRMVQYIMDDVRKFLFGGYLVQFGRIVYAPKAKIQTGHRQAPMVQPGIGWYDHMDLVPPIGYLSWDIPHHIAHSPSLAVGQGIVLCRYK